MLITAKDALDRLTGYLGDNTGQAADRDIKRAIADSLRELASDHDWSYYIAEHLINFDASQTTGTIAYSASTRQVTLTGATWPTWVAAYGVIVMGSHQSSCRIAKRISGTVIELESATAPGTDISAGATYTVYRDKYPLPDDFHKGGQLVRTGGRERLTWVAPSQWDGYGSPYLPGGGRPWRYTFLGLPSKYGQPILQITPYPSAAETVAMVYKRLPRRITTWEYKTGTVTVSSGANPTVTGSGTTWTSAMAGAVMRFVTNTTGNAPSEIDNPAVDEARIGTFTSTTSILLDGTLNNSYAGTMYSISDPIDVEYGTMLNCFYYCCLKNLASVRELKGKLDARALYDMELKEAKGKELLTMERKGVGAHARKPAQWFPI